MAGTQYPESDPRHHTAKFRGMLEDLMTHLREDVEKVDDPRAQALFETSAEVLGGLAKAYEHFDSRAEEAWRG
jgi:hypothetical protein